MVFLLAFFSFCVNADVIKQAAESGKLFEKDQRRKDIEEKRIYEANLDKDPFRGALPASTEPMPLLSMGSGDPFDIEIMEPLALSGAIDKSKNPINFHRTKQLFVVHVEGIDPKLWECTGCQERQCFVQVYGEEFPEFSFMGAKDPRQAVYTSHRKVEKGWIFVFDFPAPIKLKATTKSKKSLSIQVKTRRLEEKKSDGKTVEFLNIQEINRKKSVITVHAQAGKTLDIRHADGEILITMPKDSDLARYTPACVGEMVRGCYVDSDSAASVLHIMLTQGVKLANTWVERDEDGGRSVYKMALKQEITPKKFSQGHKIDLFQPLADEREGGDVPVHYADEEAEKNDPFAQDDAEEDWQVPDVVDAQTSEVHIAQTSEEMLRGSCVMAPKWLKDAQRAYQEMHSISAH